MSNRNRLWMYFCVMKRETLVSWTIIAVMATLGLAIWGAWAEGARGTFPLPVIQSADLNLDGAVDLRDFAHFQNQFTGPIPLWLQELIERFEMADVLYSPLAVWQYRYDGELTFYVPPRCCDVMSVLYDVYGVRICHPGGGFSGNGDGYCPGFFDERTDEVLIWEDSRG